MTNQLQISNDSNFVENTFYDNLDFLSETDFAEKNKKYMQHVINVLWGCVPKLAKISETHPIEISVDAEEKHIVVSFVDQESFSSYLAVILNNNGLENNSDLLLQAEMMDPVVGSQNRAVATRITHATQKNICDFFETVSSPDFVHRGALPKK